MSYLLQQQLKLPKLELFLLLVAVLASLVARAPQRYLEWQRSINPLDYPVQLSNDHFTGGNSKPRWIEKSEHLWQCVSGDTEPRYCTYSLDLRGMHGEGLPLEMFHSMQIKMVYRGSAERLRISLRNATQPYFNPKDWTSTQYNQVDVPVDNLEQGVTVTRDLFTVANWWLAQKKTNEKSTVPEFNGVMFMDIQVSGGSAGDKHILQLLEVSWRGSRFTNEEVYRTLIFGWVILILSLLVVRYVKLRLYLGREKKTQEELLELNSALELQNREYSELARTDSLTGLLNRLGLRDKVFESLPNWEANDTPLSIVMIDLDHFKSINDTFGHDMGDEVIVKAAEIFSQNTRGTDLIARWGGEEFLLLCQNTRLEAAKVIAEGLRTKISALEINPDLAVTASFGVASGSVRDFSQLHTLADQALYKAKAEGRNRVWPQ